MAKNPRETPENYVPREASPPQDLSARRRSQLEDDINLSAEGAEDELEDDDRER